MDFIGGNRQKRAFSRAQSQAGKSLALTIALILGQQANAAEATSSAPASYDPAFVQQILKRLDAQEDEIKALKGQLQSQGGTIDSMASSEANKKDAYPRISFHGFGDINYQVTDAAHGKNAFALGELDFFIDSRISDKFRIINEDVLAADPNTQVFNFEIERLLLQWTENDYFNVDVGRYHTGIGYYNTAFHHGTWFQTAVGRPGYLEFEDGGGLIPAHNLGVSVSGDIPSGKWGLKYLAQIGNGRSFTNEKLGNSPVQNVGDVNIYKAVNVAFSIKPEWLPGWEMGTGIYHDTLTPSGGVARTDEILGHGFVVYKNSNWEFLSEGEIWRHKTRNEPEHISHAMFGQIGRKFGVLTPYTRFTYRNASGNDPVWAQTAASPGLQYGPAAGIRWDFTQFAALKLQYDYMFQAGAEDLQSITV